MRNPRADLVSKVRDARFRINVRPRSQGPDLALTRGNAARGRRTPDTDATLSQAQMRCTLGERVGDMRMHWSVVNALLGARHRTRPETGRTGARTHRPQ